MPAGNREAQGCRTGDSRGQVSGVFLAVSVALGIYFLASLSILSVEYSVILLIALLVFFIAFLRTDFALYILIFSMLFSPEIGLGRIPGREIAVRVEDLFIIVIFFGWMAKMAITKNLAFIKKSVLNPPIFLYIFACFLSTLLGLLAGELSLRSSFFYLFKYLEYFLLYFMVINNLRDERQAKIYVGLILITCLLVSVYGLFQIPSGQRVTAPFEGKEGGEPNTFAGYLLMMMALIISLIQNIPFKKQGFWLLGFLGLTLYIFVNTGSRGAWLGFFPMLAVFIFLNKRHRFPLLLVTATFLLLLPFIMPQKMQARIKETFNPEKSVSVFGSQVTIAESAAARVDSWKTAMQIWSSKPIFGTGIPCGNVIDNQYTRVLSETGTFGFAIFVWLLSTLFTTGVLVFRGMRENRFASSVSLGFVAGMIGILIHSFSSADFILIRIMEPFWFLAAIVVSLPQLTKKETV